jgi:hypothetical protein
MAGAPGHLRMLSKGHKGPGQTPQDIASELVEAVVSEVVERVLACAAGEPTPRFLSKSALADYLGVSERRIKTLREHGLPARKIGRDLYFDVHEVGDFIDREGAAPRRLDAGTFKAHRPRGEDRGSANKRTAERPGLPYQEDGS